MIPILLLLLLAAVGPTISVLRLQPGAFMKLPDGQGRLVFDNGAANKAAYDFQENLLYVIGYRADVIHIINMANPATPVLLSTKRFNRVQQGLPDSIKVCRGGFNREFLAVSFEAPNQNEHGHVHFYELLTPGTATGDLVDLKTVVALTGYDPKSIAWMTSCAQMLVLSEGDPHEINGIFEDPEGTIEVLTPSFGDTVDKSDIGYSEADLVSAGIRKVFSTCDSTTGGNPIPPASSRKQDLEPKFVHVDKNNMAYILFQANNAIAKYNMVDFVDRRLHFYNLGTKDWTTYALDAAFEDNAISLESRPGLRSLYQPNSLTSFELDGKVWIATADQGSFRQYTLATCRFDESVEARIWRGSNSFTSALPSAVRAKLDADMISVGELGRLRVSRIRSPNDGWDNLMGGYNYLTSYGGRGFSILDPDNMNRVYDSGDSLERHFVDSTNPEELSIFNAKIGTATSAQSSLRDRASPEMGQTPSAIVAAEWDNNTHALIVANGVYGGLYVYSVSSGPSVNFESYSRRGNAGLSWAQGYASGEAVGEPEISDLLYFEDQGQKTVVTVSSKAASLSFYTLVDTP